MSAYGYKYEMEYVMSYIAMLDQPQVIGPVAEGLRLNFNVTGGTVEGPKIKGKFIPVGADWLTVRTDGIGVLDVRATIQTDDDALIYLYYKGLTDLGPDGYKNTMEGAPPPPEGIEIRTNPWFQTAHPNYQWLTRGFFVEIGKVFLDKGEVCYDIYQVKKQTYFIRSWRHSDAEPVLLSCLIRPKRIRQDSFPPLEFERPSCGRYCASASIRE